MDQILKCSYCNHNYNNLERKPLMITQCGHSICKLCVEQKIQKKQDFKCQDNQCQEDNNIISYDKINFPINHELINIIIPNQNSQQENTSFSDDNFEQDFDSENFSIEDSVETDKIKVGKQKIQESNNKINTDICQMHKKNFEVYCQQCEERCCYSCALFGDHQFHDFKTKDDIIRELKQQQLKINHIKSNVSKFQNKSNNNNILSDFHSKLSNKMKIIIEEIESEFNSTIQVLKQQKKNIIDQVRNDFQLMGENFANKFELQKQDNYSNDQSQIIDKLSQQIQLQLESENIVEQFTFLKSVEEQNFEPFLNNNQSPENPEKVKQIGNELLKQIQFSIQPIQNLEFNLNIPKENNFLKKNFSQTQIEQEKKQNLKYNEQQQLLRKPQSSRNLGKNNHQSYQKFNKKENNAYLLNQSQEIQNYVQKRTRPDSHMFLNENKEQKSIRNISQKQIQSTQKNELKEIILKKNLEKLKIEAESGYKKHHTIDNRFERISHQPQPLQRNDPHYQSEVRLPQRAVTPKIQKYKNSKTMNEKMNSTLFNKNSLRNTIRDSKRLSKKFNTKNKDITQSLRENKSKVQNKRNKSILNKKLKTSYTYTRSNEELNDTMIESILQSLNDQNIKELDFSINKLTLKSLKKLFKFIQKHPNIRIINMENNNVKQESKINIIKEFQKKGVKLTL